MITLTMHDSMDGPYWEWRVEYEGRFHRGSRETYRGATRVARRTLDLMIVAGRQLEEQTNPAADK